MTKQPFIVIVEPGQDVPMNGRVYEVMASETTEVVKVMVHEVICIRWIKVSKANGRVLPLDALHVTIEGEQL